ncbi:Conserved hypothetical protein specific to cyanobacteria [Synechococcus sp. WH 7803]|nr:Conserved hypothetical protein specific to cyanobacteria [Synechococcus sp. WH 7803]
MQAMAPSRLTDNQKQELLERYRQGESSAALADAFACSANTVSRTVRSLLSEEEYSALKASRSRGASASVPQPQPQPEAAVEVSVEDPVNPEGDDDASSGLALDDADDFGADEPEALAEEESGEGFPGGEEFHEVAVLPVDLPQVTTKQVHCLPFAAGVLPDSVYMLVDKTVELDPRPLSDFPELGVADPDEQALQALCLFTSPRTAKRQCGRSQRVIKVPDTQVFAITTRHLVARGITRLLVEGALYALDA